MTKPLFEPSTPREVAGNSWGISQLYRRPASPLLFQGWDIAATDSCFGGSSQALPVWDGRDAPPGAYSRSNFGWGGDCGGTCPPGAGTVPYDSVIFDSSGYFDYLQQLNSFFSTAVTIPPGLGGYYICTADLLIGADTAGTWDELNYPSNLAVTVPPRFSLEGDAVTDRYHGWWTITGASPTVCYESVFLVSATAILYLPEQSGPTVNIDLSVIPTAILLHTRLSGFLLYHVDGLGFEDPQWPPPP